MGHFTWLLLSHLPNIRRHHCYLPNYYTHIHNTRYDLADRCSDLGFRTIPRRTSASLHLLANTLSLLPGHQSSPANVCPHMEMKPKPPGERREVSIPKKLGHLYDEKESTQQIIQRKVNIWYHPIWKCQTHTVDMQNIAGAHLKSIRTTVDHTRIKRYS